MHFTPPPHRTQNWQVRKPAARGRKGIVVAQAESAAQAGIAILDAGGNAVDAAIATALALAAVEPWNSGLGGIGHALVQPAGAGDASAVDFGPVAPRRLDPALFPLTGRMTKDLFPWPEVEDSANSRGPLAFVVPSAVAGYAAMHARWGRLPLPEIAAPAIALARRGLPADWFTTLKIANAAATLRRYPESARIYLPDGLPPVAPYQGTPGFLRLGALAETLEQLARSGLRDFYEGEVAATLAADLDEAGAVLGADDLRGCEAVIRPAQRVAWRNRTVQLAGGLTAAPTFARVLRAMPDEEPEGAPGAAWFSEFAAAMKAAYAERLSDLGAPEGCTTHLTVCDAEGGVVALTTTLLSSMGSGVVLPRSGVLMNNGVMWFDPRPGRPNSIAPGKRPLTNMCPVILRAGGTEGGRPWLAGGGSGGRRILGAVFQLLAFVAEFGMTPEAAAHQPRIDVSGPDLISADRRLPEEVIAALGTGGAVEVVEHGVTPVNFACPNLIALNGDGSRFGISDVQSPSSAALAQP